MTHPENGKPLWTESRVETLLEEFFRKEMPPALRGPSPSRSARSRMATPSAPQHQTAKRRANSVAGVVIVGFSSLLMLMLAFLSWNGPDPAPPGLNAPVQSTTDDTPTGGNSSETRNDPLKGWNEKGPIEMRSRTRQVGTGDPSNTGENSPFPELDIEVYPLDPERPNESGLPESRSKKPRRTPLPEESRQLPENSPSESADPDEAHLNPMLPELRGLFEDPLAL